jgi:hypothetical protein
MKAVILILVVALFFAPRSPKGGDQDQFLKLDSLQAAYRAGLRSLRSPELERRNIARRRVQQLGYAGTREALFLGRGLDALLPYVKMEMLLAFFLPHDQLYVYVRTTAPERKGPPTAPDFMTFGNKMVAIPLQEDWTFPENPWDHSSQ